MKLLSTFLVIVFFAIGCQPRVITREFGPPLFAAPPTTGPAPWTHLKFARSAGEFRFAVMADRNGGGHPKIFDKAIGQLNLLQPEFVLCVGDLVAGYAETPKEILPQYQEMDRVLTRLQAPFFRVAGNHDVTYTAAMQEYPKRYGRPYYHFTYGDVLFLVLFSEDGMSPKQIEYVKAALEQNKNARWTFVFMHQPLFRYTPEHQQWAKVEAMLKDRPFTVFAGHDHIYCRHVINGREHLVLSTTGGGNKLRGASYGEFDHTVWVTMTDQGPKIVNLMMDGVHDTAIRTDKDMAIGDKVRLDVRPLFAPWPQFRGGQAEITVTNDTKEAVKVNAAFDPNPILVPASRGFALTVPAGCERTVSVKIDALWQCPVEFLSPLRGQARIEHARGASAQAPILKDLRILPARPWECPPAARKIAIDGKLDDWAGAPFHAATPAQVLNNPMKYAGPADGRFRFATAYDKDWVYVAVDVEDDKLVLPLDRPVWEQDGLEIRLCSLPEAKLGSYHNDVDDDGVLVVMLSPGKSDDKPYIWDYKPLPKGTKLACVKTAKGYIAEIAIPASYLDEKQGKRWQAFRLNVAMNDFDDIKVGAQLWWAPDWRTPETYSGSGTFLRK